MDRRHFDGPRPEWVQEFKTTEEWAAFVGEKFFSGLIPDEPFFIIFRRIEHDSSDRTSPRTWMKTEYYVGILADVVPLCGYVEAINGYSSNPGIYIATNEFMCFPKTYHDGALRERVQGRLEIQYNSYFNYTPVTKPFTPPFSLGNRSIKVGNTEVEAFSVTCGVSAMEELAIAEVHWDKRFLSWYASVVKRLHIPIESEVIKAKLHDNSVALIKGLRESHEKILKLLEYIRRISNSVDVPFMENGALTLVTDEVHAKLMTSGERSEVQKLRDVICKSVSFAKELRMDSDFSLLNIDGFDCQPAVVIKNFCTLYTIE